eukprot:6309824-Amphidinium_carterae.1
MGFRGTCKRQIGQVVNYWDLGTMVALVYVALITPVEVRQVCAHNPQRRLRSRVGPFEIILPTKPPLPVPHPASSHGSGFPQYP